MLPGPSESGFEGSCQKVMPVTGSSAVQPNRSGRHEACGVLHFFGDAVKADAVKRIDFVLKVKQSWASGS